MKPPRRRLGTPPGLLLLLLSSVLPSTAELTSPQTQVSFSSPSPLSAYVVTDAGQLFVAGTNHLYELSPRDLQRVHHVQTGPRLDSPACHASGCSDNSTATLTDNVNKLLLVDEDVPGGASAFILQQVMEQQQGYYWLDESPRTLTARDHRPAYGNDGDYFSKPNLEDVIDAALEMMHAATPVKFRPLA